jgi:DNA helicase-2/ATP-dependent DNA helicase PcrA
MVQTSALTEEQRAVVRHEEGPAVVRAVPGAGKTTALVHRIRHLVQNCGVAPDRILASSFSRDTVQDLETGLARLGVPGVDTRTLHALGLSLLRRTGTVGPPLDGSSPDPSAAARILAHRARTELATERDLDTGELGISPQDLADQVAAWKHRAIAC